MNNVLKEEKRNYSIHISNKYKERNREKGRGEGGEKNFFLVKQSIQTLNNQICMSIYGRIKYYIHDRT